MFLEKEAIFTKNKKIVLFPSSTIESDKHEQTTQKSAEEYLTLFLQKLFTSVGPKKKLGTNISGFLSSQ